MALSAGSRLGVYEIVALVGSGGMGEVYRAHDSRLGRDVAIKTLPQVFTTDPERLARFEREARVLAALNHPHVATIHGIEEGSGTLALVLEFVEGPTLADLIATGPIPVKETLTIAHQIAGALEAAHEKGIIHRDLKPANIKVGSNGFVKVLDFGLAKMLADDAAAIDSPTVQLGSTNQGVVLGTAAYMSPEQARGKPTDKRTDVWAFGCVLYEMLTGKPAFARETMSDTIAAVLEHEPDWKALPDALPAGVGGILGRCLEKDSTQRLRDLGDARLEIADALGHLVSSGASRRASSSATRRVAGRPLWRLASASALVIAVAALLTFQFLGTRRAAAIGIGAGGRPAVAVVAFENPEGNQDLGWMTTAVPNMLITGLGQTPGLDVVSRERLREVAGALGLSAQPIDASRMLEVARRSGAGSVVAGSVFKAGAELRVDVQVQDVGSGRLIGALTVRSSDGIFRVVDELTGRIQAALHVEQSAVGQPIADITSASVEAYRLYSDGFEAWLNLRLVEARQLLRQAVDHDPTFASAYLPLIGISRQLGDMAAGAEYDRKVRANLNRLPERQRLLFEANARQRADDAAQAAAFYERLLARYPDEEKAYHELSNVHSKQLRDAEGAIAVMQRGAKALPYSGALRNDLGYALLRAGRYSEAEREFETYARLRPREANPYDSLGETYLVSGQPELAIEKYGHALELDPTFFSSHEGRAWAFAMLGRYGEALGEYEEVFETTNQSNVPEARGQFASAFLLSRVGRYREAEQRITRGLLAAERVKNPDATASLLCLSMLLSIERAKPSDALVHVGKLHQAVESIAPTARRNWQVLAALLTGVAEARTGKREAARARLEEESRVYDHLSVHQNWWHHTLEAEVALAAGDLTAAGQAYGAGEPTSKTPYNLAVLPVSVLANNLFRDGSARVQTAQQHLSSAAEIYRRLLRAETGQKWTGVLEPRFVLELARVLEKQGAHAEARKEYRRFLDLWNKADADSPEVAEARRGGS